MIFVHAQYDICLSFKREVRRERETFGGKFKTNKIKLIDLNSMKIRLYCVFLVLKYNGILGLSFFKRSIPKILFSEKFE